MGGRDAALASCVVIVIVFVIVFRHRHRHRLRFRHRYRSLFRFQQVGDALPEGVCPVGDVQAEGFLYLGLVQNGVRVSDEW